MSEASFRTVKMSILPCLRDDSPASKRLDSSEISPRLRMKCRRKLVEVEVAPLQTSLSLRVLLRVGMITHIDSPSESTTDPGLYISVNPGHLGPSTWASRSTTRPYSERAVCLSTRFIGLPVAPGITCPSRMKLTRSDRPLYRTQSTSTRSPGRDRSSGPP